MAKEYIERDAVVKELQEELDYESLRYTKEQNKYIDIGLGIALRTVKRLPAADVVEVKRGYWIEVTKNMSWKCSECGELSCCNPNFCHNCGADMRERRDNNAE